MKEISFVDLKSISGGDESKFSFIACIPLVTSIGSSLFAFSYFEAHQELININYVTGVATYAVYPNYALSILGGGIGFAVGLVIMYYSFVAYDYFANLI